MRFSKPLSFFKIRGIVQWVYIGIGGVAFDIERNKVQQMMNYIGAWESDGFEKCERCCNYVDSKRSGSKYFGGCVYHQVK